MIHEKKAFTLKELSAGLDVQIQGDPQCPVDHICTIQEGKPGGLTFLVNPLYRKHLSSTSASAVILAKSHAADCSVNAIVAPDPYYTFSRMAAYFDDRPKAVAGIHPTAIIGQHCMIDPTASIGPHTVVADHVRIGKHVQIGPLCTIGEYSQIDEFARLDASVTLYHRIHIGKRVIVSSGTVIGSDGFGIAKHQGIWHKVPQLGNVILEDDVEIGANCTIDRAAIGHTLIAKGAKIDNQVQVAHNVRIGEHTAIAGCVGISGSTTIGNHCMIGGQTGFAGHLTISDNVMVTGGTEVTKSIRAPGIYSSGVGGLVTNQERRKNTARVQRLDRLFDQVKLLKQALKDLTERKKA